MKIEDTVMVLKKTTDKYSNNIVLGNKFKLVLNTQENIEGAIEVWKKLVNQHPDRWCL